MRLNNSDNSPKVAPVGPSHPGGFQPFYAAKVSSDGYTVYQRREALQQENQLPHSRGPMPHQNIAGFNYVRAPPGFGPSFLNQSMKAHEFPPHVQFFNPNQAQLGRAYDQGQSRTGVDNKWKAPGAGVGSKVNSDQANLGEQDQGGGEDEYGQQEDYGNGDYGDGDYGDGDYGDGDYSERANDQQGYGESGNGPEDYDAEAEQFFDDCAAETLLDANSHTPPSTTKPSNTPNVPNNKIAAAASVASSRLESNSKSEDAKPVSSPEQTPEHPELEPEPTIADPLTISGQRLGAHLSIMRAPNKIKKITKGSAYNMVMEVGDIVKVLAKVTVSDTNGKDYLDYAVENLRTGAKVIVAWNTFLPVGVREMCDCRGQRCRCVYVDFEKSRRFFGVGN